MDIFEDRARIIAEKLVAKSISWYVLKSFNQFVLCAFFFLLNWWSRSAYNTVYTVYSYTHTHKQTEHQQNTLKLIHKLFHWIMERKFWAEKRTNKFWSDRSTSINTTMYDDETWGQKDIYHIEKKRERDGANSTIKLVRHENETLERWWIPIGIDEIIICIIALYFIVFVVRCIIDTS